MNLRDYIGDTRTESLPPGFLKSIKIKYKHEASRVFAGLPPCSWQNEAERQIENVAEAIAGTKEGSGEEDEKNDVQNEEQDVPSFMNWRVPSRLLNQKYDKTSPGDASEKNSISKSASSNSGHSTATTIGSLTSVAAKRGSKSSEQNEQESKDAKSLAKARENSFSKRNSGKGSNQSKHSNIEDKKCKATDKHIKPVNSKILKPITLKLNKEHSSAAKEANQPHSKHESNEGFQKNFNEEKAVAEDNLRVKTGGLRPQKKAPNQNPPPQVVDNSKEEFSSHKAQMKLDDVQRAAPGDPNEKLRTAEEKTVADGKRFSNICLKSVTGITELPKMKDSLPKCNKLNPQIKENDNVLPALKATGSRTSNKLSQTPERMDKIHEWVKKSTRREREAAFSLLSAYNSSENIQTKTSKKNERVRIALQLLERKRPDSIRPLQLNNIKRNTTAVMRLDQKTLENYTSQLKKEGMKSWHHMRTYHLTNTVPNKSALFVQPSKAYQRHFSIHPEWGLHTRVKLTNPIRS